jgi:WD40 repeat protein
MNYKTILSIATFVFQSISFAAEVTPSGAAYKAKSATQLVLSDRFKNFLLLERGHVYREFAGNPFIKDSIAFLVALFSKNPVRINLLQKAIFVNAPLTICSNDGNAIISVSRNERELYLEKDGIQVNSKNWLHRKPIVTMEMDPRNRFVATGSLDKSVALWSLADLSHQRTLYPGSKVNLLAWNKNGSQLATALSNNSVKIWDPYSPKPVAILKGHKDKITSIFWSPNEVYIATGSLDGKIKIWNSETFELMQTISRHSSINKKLTWNGKTSTIFSLAWSPDSSTIATGHKDGTIRFWNLQMGYCLTPWLTEKEKSSIKFIEWHARKEDTFHNFYDLTVICNSGEVRGYNFEHVRKTYSQPLRSLCLRLYKIYISRLEDRFESIDTYYGYNSRRYGPLTEKYIEWRGPEHLPSIRSLFPGHYASALECMKQFKEGEAERKSKERRMMAIRGYLSRY